MDRFHVLLKPKAYEDIDEIYEYISLELKNDSAALQLVDELEKAILSLGELPLRGAERKIGTFSNRGYRQVFVENFTIIYRVDMKQKRVIIVHVIYSKRNM